MTRLSLAPLLVALLFLGGCGYNTLQSQDEGIKAAWSEVINQYQRRADLIPNLVATVQGFAKQEKDVLLGVTNARAKVGSIQASPEMVDNPETFQRFVQAQGELTGALSRLLVVVENYPQLKSDANFQRLMDELSGTENRIAVARGRYNERIQEYNTTRRRFPSNMTAKIFGFEEYPYFEAPAATGSGGFEVGDGGLTILNVDSVEEAQAIMATYPMNDIGTMDLMVWDVFYADMAVKENEPKLRS